MILDTYLTFSDAQAPGNTGANDSTSHIDLQSSGYKKPWLVVSIPTAIAATGGAATIAFALHDSADDTTFTATTVSVAATSKDDLTAGKVVIRQPLPSNIQRYLKMVYTVATNNITSGGIDAYLTDEVQTNR